MLRIKMYAAKDGDAFLISSDKTQVLIDGGYSTTFTQAIEADLLNLTTESKCLDLVLVTHIDADHIGGILRLLNRNGKAHQPAVIPIKQIWHNSLRSLTSRERYEIPADQLPLLKAINQRGHPAVFINEKSKKSPEQISATQGSSLARLIFEGGYCWNGGNGTVPVCEGSNDSFTHSGDSIIVLTPTAQQLRNLLALWKKNLARAGYRVPSDSRDIMDDAFEFTLEHLPEDTGNAFTQISSNRIYKLPEIYTADNSVQNGSSVSAIFEIDGKRLLMLADAHAEEVVQALEALAEKGESMVFDAIKISHHGSLHNTSPELLKLIDSPSYFISTDGSKHGHPDMEVLTAIVDRPSDFIRTLYFNYSTNASRRLCDYTSESKASFNVVENATDWVEIGNK